MFIHLLLFLLFTCSSFQTEITYDDYINYINGKEINSSNDLNYNYSYADRNCDCDLTQNSCDYLCCCDDDCDDEWKEYWRNHLSCIDEKDSIGIFADRCIDKNLIWKNNDRRGLKKYNQTEDIKKQSNTLINFCFSIDNSNKKPLKTLDNLTKDFGIKFKPEIVFTEYFEQKLLKEFFNNNIKNNKELILSNGTNFAKNGYFMLYSGIYCSLLKTVEIGKTVSASCKMRNDFEISNVTNFTGDIILKNGDNKSVQCTHWKTYEKDEKGFLLPNASKSTDWNTSYRVLEVEFILQTGNGTNIQKCYYNRVVSMFDTKNEFKNSVKFIEYDLNGKQKLQFRYRGDKGYLNSSPLKIIINTSNELSMSNEFLLIGRDNENNCRDDNDYLKHLYNKDKPLLFGEKIIYYCNYKNSQINQTTLYKKIFSIKSLGKHGSSIFPYTNGNNWVNCDRDKKSCKRENKENIIIKMQITTENIVGINNETTITGCNLFCENDTSKNGGLLIFQTEYITKDYEDVFTKIPQRPHFIPRLPSDLLNPLITSNVTK